MSGLRHRFPSYCTLPCLRAGDIVGRAFAALILLATAACAPASPDRRQTRAGDSRLTSPQIADGYVRLLRRQLTDSNPAEAQQQLMCEVLRVYDVLGDTEGRRRLEEAEDTAYTPADAPARRRVEQALANKTFGVGVGCDSSLWGPSSSIKKPATRGRDTAPPGK